MIIFLYGQDTYQSRQKLNEIIEHYKKIHKSGLNLKYFDGENLDFQEFREEIQSTSMFKEKKLLVLKNTITNKNFQENFLKNPKLFLNSDDIILFYEQGKIPESNQLFEFLKKHGKSQEFKLLEIHQLKNWVKKEFEKYQVKIEPKALDRLINFVGNDLWQINNEIKKLANYKNKPPFAKASGGKQKIEVKDIELLVRPKIETDIFKTIDALASKNKKQALELIHKHLEKGDNPLYLLSMINFQFRNLLMVKDLIEKSKPYLTILNLTKLHPFIVKKSFSQAKKFNREELKKIYQKIFQVDLSIKTGKVEPKVALDILVADI